MLPAKFPSTTTASGVPVGRFTWLTRTSSSTRLLWISNCANPLGTTPFNVGPLRPANRSPALPGDGEGLGLTDGEGLGLTDGEGLGLTDGLTDGEGDGDGAGPLTKAPFTTTVEPVLTSMVDPAVTFGTL